MAPLLSSLVTSYTTDDSLGQEEALENVALLWPRPTLQLPLSGLPSVRPPSAGSTEGRAGPGTRGGEARAPLRHGNSGNASTLQSPDGGKAGSVPASPALETQLTWY